MPLLSLLLVHILGVDDRAFFLLAATGGLGAVFRTAAGPGLGAAGAGLFAGGLVKLGRDGLPSFVQFVRGRADRRGVTGFQRFLHLVNRRFDLAFVVAG